MGTSEKKPLLRREKEDPCADFWHTLQIGVPIGVAMLLILPVVFRFFWP